MSQRKAGAVLSYVSIIISISIALVYTPVMIRLLGQSEYGLYSLIGSLAAYFSIMDMGLGNAMVRFTARNRVVGDSSETAKLNGMFLTIYSFIGIITVIVGAIVYNNVEAIFGSSLTANEIYKAKLMIIILIINFSLSFPLSIFNSIIRAYEKFVVEGVLSIIRIVASPVIIIPALLMGYGSVTMVLITTIVNISCLLFSLYYALKKLKVKVYFGKIKLNMLKEVVAYSFFVFLNVIVDQFFWKTDQMILGIISGTAIVAVYAIAMQFINLFMRFSSAIANLFLPKVSMMEANHATNEEFTKEMVKFGRVQFLIIALILSGFIVFGRNFIKLWAGNSYEEAYFIALIIMVPLTVPLIQNIGISILQAKNLHGFRSVIYLLVAILKVFITIPLANLYGGIGAAVTTVLSLVIAHIIIMNIYYHKKIGLNMFWFWKNIIKLSIPVFFVTITGLLASTIIPQDSLFLIGPQVIVFTMLYFLFVWTIGMNSYEKKLVRTFLIKVSNKL